MLKPGAQDSILASLVGGRGPSTWAISAAFPGALARSWIEVGQYLIFKIAHGSIIITIKFSIKQTTQPQLPVASN